MTALHFDWITIPAGDCWIGSDPTQDPLWNAPCQAEGRSEQNKNDHPVH